MCRRGCKAGLELGPDGELLSFPWHWFPPRMQQFVTVSACRELDDLSSGIIGLELDGYRCACLVGSQKALLTHHVVWLLNDYVRSDGTAVTFRLPLPGVTVFPPEQPVAPDPGHSLPDSSYHFETGVVDNRVAALVWEWSCLRELVWCTWRDMYWPPQEEAPFRVLLGDHTGQA